MHVTVSPLCSADMLGSADMFAGSRQLLRHLHIEQDIKDEEKKKAEAPKNALDILNKLRQQEKKRREVRVVVVVSNWPY